MWLSAIAAIGWLHVATTQRLTARIVHVASSVVMAPLVFDWSRLLPISGLVGQWLLNFVMALLSVAAIAAYPLKRHRVTAVIAALGIAWWLCIACLSLD
jgi:hypothetical protein